MCIVSDKQTNKQLMEASMITTENLQKNIIGVTEPQAFWLNNCIIGWCLKG